MRSPSEPNFPRLASKHIDMTHSSCKALVGLDNIDKPATSYGPAVRLAPLGMTCVHSLWSDRTGAVCLSKVGLCSKCEIAANLMEQI